MAAQIDINGNVRKTKVVETSGYSSFDNAAINAIGKTEFKPAQKDGKPIAVWISIPVVFKLKK